MLSKYGFSIAPSHQEGLSRRVLCSFDSVFVGPRLVVESLVMDGKLLLKLTGYVLDSIVIRWSRADHDIVGSGLSSRCLFVKGFLIH